MYRSKYILTNKFSKPKGKYGKNSNILFGGSFAKFLMDTSAF